jgi:hypothetical protein
VLIGDDTLRRVDLPAGMSRAWLCSVSPETPPVSISRRRILQRMTAPHHPSKAIVSAIRDQSPDSAADRYPAIPTRRSRLHGRHQLSRRIGTQPRLEAIEKMAAEWCSQAPKHASDVLSQGRRDRSAALDTEGPPSRLPRREGAPRGTSQQRERQTVPATHLWLRGFTPWYFSFWQTSACCST